MFKVNFWDTRVMLIEVISHSLANVLEVLNEFFFLFFFFFFSFLLCFVFSFFLFSSCPCECACVFVGEWLHEWTTICSTKNWQKCWANLNSGYTKAMKTLWNETKYNTSKCNYADHLSFGESLLGNIMNEPSFAHRQS